MGVPGAELPSFLLNMVRFCLIRGWAGEECCIKRMRVCGTVQDLSLIVAGAGGECCIWRFGACGIVRSLSLIVARAGGCAVFVGWERVVQCGA